MNGKFSLFHILHAPDMTALPKAARQGRSFLACNECRLQSDKALLFLCVTVYYALMFLDLMSEASAEDRLQLRFLCNTLPGGPVKQTNMMSAGERRGGLLRQMRERARGRLRKANDMLCQSWEVTGMMEYIYIAETLCLGKRGRLKEREMRREGIGIREAVFLLPLLKKFNL